MRIGPCYFMTLTVVGDDLPRYTIKEATLAEAVSQAKKDWATGRYSRVYVIDEYMGGTHWVNGHELDEYGDPIP